jgi:hypothetical protein
MGLTDLLLILSGLLVFGEALALLTGMFVVQKGASPWLTASNRMFLLIDLSAGMCMLLAGLHILSISAGYWMLVVLLASIASHIYRDWEFLQGAPNAFCGNRNLFLFNNLKLVILVISLLVLSWLLLVL